jgi:hypothetical protein
MKSPEKRPHPILGTFTPALTVQARDIKFYRGDAAVTAAGQGVCQIPAHGD